ncbi:EsvB, partial [Acinetobacter sp. V2]
TVLRASNTQVQKVK